MWELLAQQREQRIPQTFKQGVHTGSQQAQAIKQFGITRPQLRETRWEPITPTDIPTDSRWVYPAQYHEETLWDTFDEIQTAFDPKGGYAGAIMAGMNVTHDAECIRAFFEASHNGQLGTTTITFPITNTFYGGTVPWSSTWTTGNQIPVNWGASGNTGLTVAKLRQARMMLLSNEVDMDAGKLYAICKATQLDNLLAEAQVINRDFNQPEAPVLEEGKITRFLGLDFIHSEQLYQDANPYTWVPVYHSQGMHFGTWKGIETRITERNDLVGHPWQIAVNAAFGATRLQEKMVMQILTSP
jgi:hypothetical protein